ncbi:probably inactive leucine-rich repeat receptor-like protein kinase At5g48380 isoform X2 [Lycium ferocissimum]|uniref:probably inactive leucine-rich repeat receptor-like protein kinase At5g48380 isoform X2 n=1 Tax=Lycium ferocissimum TaxID=112874 RepID=UPI002815DC99|nr:probably inactive leucine-rich repeat receptor-like protein kinase At5g48380 isoform X2 [Lycium ferocissimum]
MTGPFTKMVSNCGAFTTLICLLLSCTVCCALQSDIDCLNSIKNSLEDTSNILANSWNFNNRTEGFICKFTGVDCWHPDENRVLAIRLPDMGLKGEFPLGIQNCKSLTALDLSNNKLNGSIPSNISKVIGFVVNLDLSSNKLSGEIPADLANCSYLNNLKLDNNRLKGLIPPQIGLLGRLKTFNVANNQLTGQIPNFTNGTTFPAEDYANNPGLCGGPLPVCRGPPKKSSIGLIVGTTIGGLTVAAVAMAIGMFFYLRRMSRKKKKDQDPDGNKWAKSIKGAKAIKSVSKMRLSDLMKASDNFNKNNIIGSGRTGTVYRAVLDDGTSLMVKRLQNTQHSEKEFVSEMATLGKVKNRNLVPLLGFCVAKKERLLVYKDMPNGNLHDKLHVISEGDKVLEWPLRIKIGIGAAKGFAWLHHNCNPRIIHRNISSKCILLDVEFEPRISDFGLARLMNPIDTHLSTFVNGEFGDMGYVAPEYLRTLVATPKGDVYSFGVVLLELVTGERPTYVTKAPESFKGNLVEWITHLSGESMLQDAIDSSLSGKGYDEEVFQVLKVACRCVLSTAKERPTMFEVYQLLRVIGERYNFTTENDILMPSESDDGFQMVEFIVAQDVKEAC